MRHAGRQEADARELLAADDLVGAFGHLAIEVVANFAEALRHRVHRLGEFADFVAGVDLDAMVEVPGGDQPRAVDQHLQRIGEPLVEKTVRDDEHHHHGAKSDPGENDRRAVAGLHVVGDFLELVFEIGRQSTGQALAIVRSVSAARRSCVAVEQPIVRRRRQRFFSLSSVEMASISLSVSHSRWSSLSSEAASTDAASSSSL